MSKQQAFLFDSQVDLCILADNICQYDKVLNDIRETFEIQKNPIYIGHHNIESAFRGCRSPFIIFHEGNMQQELLFLLHRHLRWAYHIQVRQPPRPQNI